MSEVEVRRAGLLDRVAAGELKLGKAAKLMQVSYRQAKRLWRRYRKEGAPGLAHGNAGRPSHHAKPRRFRQKVLRVVRQQYGGAPGERFGPTLASEQLEKDHGLKVDAETLRRWMLAEGLWSRERKRKPHRQRRERKEHFGELVQMDGSFHDWLEGRGPRGCLMDMVDDATGRTLARLGAEETTWAAADALEAWIGEYGVPAALYTDWKNVYVRKPTERELLRGEAPLTQFGRMCARLEIRIIPASSPQAKGRVERKNGVHQDRLIKQMRLKKINTFEQANHFLEQHYLREHNKRFAVAPADPTDFHRQLERKLNLRTIFCLEEERTLSNDWVIRYKNRLLQVGSNGKVYPPAQAKVTIYEWRDGSLHLFYRGQLMSWKEIERLKEAPPKTAYQPAHPSRHRTQPAREHPWRKSYVGIRIQGRGSAAAAAGEELWK